MAHDFGIVIPLLNQSQWLETCLRSIVHQEGSSTVHVHVQDGGSTDEAERIVERVRYGLDTSRFLLSYSREPDRNAADAINKGMGKIKASMLTWLGADDLLLPGCLEAVRSVREAFPRIRWVTGHPQTMSDRGILLPVHGPAGVYRLPTGYSREAIRRGLHASVANHGTIQQEGTFWEASLWEAVGGLNDQLSLAFDFDLWCRMADYAELAELVTPLGAFRKRRGQASGNQIGYAAEVELVRQTRRIAVKSKRARTYTETLEVFYPKNMGGVWKRARTTFVVLYGQSPSKSFSFPLLGSFPHSAKNRLARVVARKPRLRAFLRRASRTFRI